MNKKGKVKKPQPPFPNREVGDRAATGMVPPFYPKGKDPKESRSYWGKNSNKTTKD